jgi:peptidoglycan/LPS O-acetylase OafA/YrhL
MTSVAAISIRRPRGRRQSRWRSRQVDLTATATTPTDAATATDAATMQASASAPPRLTHMPALDGLRGLAVAGVLLFHGGFAWAAGGYLGVSAFFTLSGFLITSLLLLEREATGRIDFRRFWARRFRRLLPAALVALAGIVLFGACVATPDQVRALRGDVLAALGYGANWRFVLNGQSYLALFTEPSPVQHFWSLSIEEQFYLAFPLVVAALLALGAGSRRPLGYVLAGAAVASTGLMALLHTPGGDTARAYYGTDTRIAELLVGAILALAVTPAPGRVSGRPNRRSALALDAAGAVALVGMLAMWWRVEQARPWLYQGGFALHALLAATVIASIRTGGLVSRALALRPLRQLGRVSYGLYLYHWPIFLWLTPRRTGLDGWGLFGVRTATALAAAIVSFVVVESPIRGGLRLRGWQPAVFAPAAAALVATAVVVVTLDPPKPAVVLSAVSSGPPTTLAPRSTTPTTEPGPRTTTPDSPLHRPFTDGHQPRVLVVGDSVAVSLGRGLERWGLSTHRAAVWNAARMWCSIGRYAQRPLPTGASQGAECNSWESRWAQEVQDFDPDTVVVLSTIWEIVDRRLDGWDGWKRLGDPTYDAWLLSEYETAVDVLTARGATVVWMTIPCLRDASAEQRALIDDYNTRFLPRLVRERPQVRIYDLAGKVCPDGGFTDSIGGIDGFRPDGAHFSDSGSDWVASWFMPDVLRD